ncbi:MAG TPA: cytochrome c biogenesis protein ResB [Gemmataceae bacterium]|jgi:hypothetical protein|nr:cytochrome c biogenesis protein ResB [Gemmataceae bacterium]
MSRKKHPANQVGITTRPKAATAGTNGVAKTATGVTAQPLSLPKSPAAPKRRAEERFWLEKVIVRISRLLGSLQAAVVLLITFAGVLITGTVMESWYDGPVTQQLVYRTWWFTVLLALLAVNIFFAAAKKWPWKKHQTGFLITHVGLLTLLAGGILNSLGGTDALMVAVDTEDPAYSDYGPSTTSRIVDRDVSRVVVERPHKKGEEPRQFFFEPGPLTWSADEYIQPKLDGLAAVLGAMAHPLPRHQEWGLGDGARLEVLNSYPHVRDKKFGPARHDESDTFPAIKFQLASPMAGILPEKWVAGHGGHRVAQVGPGMVELLGKNCSPALVEEFRNPPPASQAGRKGQLVLVLDGHKYGPFDVDQCLGQAQPLGGSGWKLTMAEYVPDFARPGSDVAENPAVKFDLVGENGRVARYATVARFAGELFPVSKDDEVGRELDKLRVWYHPPDYRWGSPSVRALLQFVTAKDGKLYYRSFNSHKGSFQFEKAGTVAEGQKRQRIWEGMNWKFRVTEFVPEAVGPPYYVPEDRRLGLEDEDTPPAIRCRITAGKESKEFWVPKTDESATSVLVGEEAFRVGYNTYARNLDFEITLQRAEQTSDPGTGAAASYTSYVLLADKKNHIDGEPHVITMNQPLDYHGIKLYQSGYTSLFPDQNSKPVNRSVFTVSKDPGLWLKYAGSSMLALGIACMFYMKAYFFKPRGRSRAATRTPSPDATPQEA